MAIDNDQLDEWVDLIADRFEAAWKGGSRPAIADFANEFDNDQRKVLLAELVNAT